MKNKINPINNDTPQEIFCFHIVKLSLLQSILRLLFPLHKTNIVGLNHSETFYTMELGTSIFNISRYNFRKLAIFTWWESEEALKNFLQNSPHVSSPKAWYIKIRPYRKWGDIKEISKAKIFQKQQRQNQPVVAITIARLRLTQAFRFIKWGKPVEKQVRDHNGQTLALAAMRPFNTFCTFSIWKSEKDMIGMVQGLNEKVDGLEHKKAMEERNRKPFHYEFTTLRLTPVD